jgi:hypothetical protein
LNFTAEDESGMNSVERRVKPFQRGEVPIESQRSKK